MKCANFAKRQRKQPRYLDDALKLWRDVAVATSTTEAADSPDIPGKWANQAFKDYLILINKLDETGVL